MSDLNVLPLAVGSSSTSAVLAPLLGTIYRTTTAAGVTTFYRLCKSSAALLVNGVVTTAYTAGVPTFNVGHSALAADVNVVGVVPSAYTSGVATGTYFMAQISGACSVISGDTLTVALSGTEMRIVTFTTASAQVRLVSTFTTASTGDAAGVFGFVTATAAATAAGGAIAAVLTGLVDRF